MTIIIHNQAEAEQLQQREAQAYAAFEKAEEGFFDGFAMADIFHRKYNKADALEILFADDYADVTTSTGATIHAGSDGVTVYVMSEAARNGNAKKIVRFNRSVYAF